MRLTVPGPSFVTHAEPAPYTSAYGELPTPILACRLFVRALNRVTRPL